MLNRKAYQSLQNSLNIPLKCVDLRGSTFLLERLACASKYCLKYNGFELLMVAALIVPLLMPKTHSFTSLHKNLKKFSKSAMYSSPSRVWMMPFSIDYSQALLIVSYINFHPSLTKRFLGEYNALLSFYRIGNNHLTLLHREHSYQRHNYGRSSLRVSLLFMAI